MKVLQFKREQAETEGARRATEGSACSKRSKIPDPEVPERARRRRFTAEYKIRILREADACRGDGDIGALLRREGLYSSNLAAWRRQRDAIAREGLASRKRGRKAKQIDPRIKELERENTRLMRRLKKTEIILDFQKKASELLGISLENPDSEEND
jgi:transposase-like protein